MSDDVLDQVTVQQLLQHLAPESRLVVELSFGLALPPDWPWPDIRWPTYAAIGAYVGQRFRGRPLSEATIRYIRTTAIKKLTKIARNGR